MNWVGQPVLRKEGRSKVTGTARYVADLDFPGALYAATVRSPVPRGRIRNIRFADGIPWKEFTIVRAEDIPGDNVVVNFERDQPFLADSVVNHPGEAIVLIAHPDRYLVERATAHVHIDIEPLPAVLTLEESLKQTEIIWGSDNIMKSYQVEKGNVDSVWDQAYAIMEGEYSTEAQEQLYIENHGMVAAANPKDGVTVWGSLQCPFYVHRALKTLFGLPDDRIQVIQTETGGAFGGKEDYPSIIAGHAALLAWKSGKPVKLLYRRMEDMAVTTKRHPSRTRIKTAVDKNGKLLAVEIDFVLDGGAYATLSAVVLSRGTLHATGPYFCPNVRIRSRVVATNVPPHGAFRGFGAPQSIFAIERHMDKIAKALVLSPDEIRRRNFLKKGDTTATEQLIKEDVDYPALLDEALRLSDFCRKRKEFETKNALTKIKKGIGLSAFMHGAGFTGSGEKFLASVAAVEADPTGRVHVLASSTEIGQGKDTVFAQIAAETLGLNPDDIEIVRPDTRRVPDSGPTVASRTTMIVGKLVEKASSDIRKILTAAGLLKDDYSHDDFIRACRLYHERFGKLRAQSQYEPPANILWDDKKYRGDAYATYAWAVYVAEVSVDTLTYETKVDHFVATQEVGRVINPVLAEGQIEGGVAQGIGFALYEKVSWNAGRMANSQMTNYIVPTALDVPPITVFFDERNRHHGPSGAKGIGELPLDGPAPAILNAVENATGAAIDHVPLMPENLMEALGGGNAVL